MGIDNSRSTPLTDNEKYIRDRATVMSIIKYLLIAAVAALLLFFATRVISVLIPFLVGFLLAKTAHAIATPIRKLNHNKTIVMNKKTKRAELAIYWLLVLFIILVAGYAIFTLIGQASRAFSAMQNYAANISDMVKFEKWLWSMSESKGGFIKDSFVESILLNITEIEEELMARIPDIISTTVASVWNIIGNIPYGIFVVISIFMSGFYFISDGPYVLKAYMKTIPNHSFRRKSLSLINDLSVTLFRALGGYLLLLIITMVEAWIAFRLAGVEFALVLALITAVLDFLPVLGISATMIPVAIYCAIHENYTGVIIIVIAITVMTIIRRLIEPPIVGKTLHIHPLLMLISMALGVYIWGAIGFLLGPVVFIIIMDILKVFGMDRKFQTFLSHVLEKVSEPEKTQASD
ncbi:MAG: AI-2E family transporter [Clostridiales bacterium]|nr:AI-2E family transporter [Clostridiales bacterium]